MEKDEKVRDQLELIPDISNEFSKPCKYSIQFVGANLRVRPDLAGSDVGRNGHAWGSAPTGRVVS